MYSRANPWQSYRQVVTQTASPGQLVLMLYDGAIRFLEQARQGYDKDDPLEFNESINNGIQRTQDILDEMNRALDLERGGEFAANMRRLYDYFDRRLQESNIYKKPDGVEDVLRRITILRDAWREMLAKGGNPAEAASPTPEALAPAMTWQA